MDRRYGPASASPLEYVRFYLRFYPPHDMGRCWLGAREFLKRRIRPRMLPAARALIAATAERPGRHRSPPPTASSTEPIAAAFGIEHLMATEPQIVDGRFTGDIVGEPCMREGKIAHLDRWLAARGKTLRDFAGSWFYSDSINDLPLLERVTHPVAVDPDSSLEKIARDRGWRRLTLRR